MKEDNQARLDAAEEIHLEKRRESVQGLLGVVATPKFGELDESKLSPLHLAVINKNVNDLLELLDIDNIEGVDLNARDENGCTPLHYAAGNGEFECARELLKAGADPTVKDTVYGRTPLHDAILCGNKSVVKELMATQFRAAVNARDNNSWSPLHYSVHLDDYQVLRTLIECGANVDTGDSTDRTCLHVAAWFQRVEHLVLLLNKGADPNAQDDDGNTPLHRGVKAGNTDIVEMLLRYGADPSVRNAQGETALFTAIKNDHESLVFMLASTRIGVDSKNFYGNTALHVAAMMDRTIFCRILKTCGANLSQLNYAGQKSCEMTNIPSLAKDLDPDVEREEAQKEQEGPTIPIFKMDQKPEFVETSSKDLDLLIRADTGFSSESGNENVGVEPRADESPTEEMASGAKLLAKRVVDKRKKRRRTRALTMSVLDKSKSNRKLRSSSAAPKTLISKLGVVKNLSTGNRRDSRKPSKTGLLLRTLPHTLNLRAVKKKEEGEGSVDESGYLRDISDVSAIHRIDEEESTEAASVGSLEASHKLTDLADSESEEDGWWSPGSGAGAGEGERSSLFSNRTRGSVRERRKVAEEMAVRRKSTTLDWIARRSRCPVKRTPSIVYHQGLPPSDFKSQTSPYAKSPLFVPSPLPVMEILEQVTGPTSPTPPKERERRVDSGLRKRRFSRKTQSEHKSLEGAVLDPSDLHISEASDGGSAVEETSKQGEKIGPDEGQSEVNPSEQGQTDGGVPSVSVNGEIKALKRFEKSERRRKKSSNLKTPPHSRRQSVALPDNGTAEKVKELSTVLTKISLDQKLTSMGDEPVPKGPNFLPISSDESTSDSDSDSSDSTSEESSESSSHDRNNVSEGEDDPPTEEGGDSVPLPADSTHAGEESHSLGNDFLAAKTMKQLREVQQLLQKQIDKGKDLGSRLSDGTLEDSAFSQTSLNDSILEYVDLTLELKSNVVRLRHLKSGLSSLVAEHGVTIKGFVDHADKLTATLKAIVNFDESVPARRKEVRDPLVSTSSKGTIAPPTSRRLSLVAEVRPSLMEHIKKVATLNQVVGVLAAQEEAGHNVRGFGLDSALSLPPVGTPPSSRRQSIGVDHHQPLNPSQLEALEVALRAVSMKLTTSRADTLSSAAHIESKPLPKTPSTSRRTSVVAANSLEPDILQHIQQATSLCAALQSGPSRRDEDELECDGESISATASPLEGQLHDDVVAHVEHAAKLKHALLKIQVHTSDEREGDAMDDAEGEGSPLTETETHSHSRISHLAVSMFYDHLEQAEALYRILSQLPHQGDVESDRVPGASGTSLEQELFDHVHRAAAMQETMVKLATEDATEVDATDSDLTSTTHASTMPKSLGSRPQKLDTLREIEENSDLTSESDISLDRKLEPLDGFNVWEHVSHTPVEGTAGKDDNTTSVEAHADPFESQVDEAAAVKLLVEAKQTGKPSNHKELLHKLRQVEMEVKKKIEMVEAESERVIMTPSVLKHPPADISGTPPPVTCSPYNAIVTPSRGRGSVKSRRKPRSHSRFAVSRSTDRVVTGEMDSFHGQQRSSKQRAQRPHTSLGIASFSINSKNFSLGHKSAPLAAFTPPTYEEGVRKTFWKKPSSPSSHPRKVHTPQSATRSPDMLPSLGSPRERQGSAQASTPSNAANSMRRAIAETKRSHFGPSSPSSASPRLRDSHANAGISVSPRRNASYTMSPTPPSHRLSPKPTPRQECSDPVSVVRNQLL